jgi:hypothetical protein
MQANLDGFALAIGADPALAAGATHVDDDTADDLEIGRSTSYLRPLIGAGFVLTFFSASASIGWWDGAGELDMAGFAGVLLFGLVTCRLIRMLPSDRGPVVIVSRYGIRDRRVGNEFLLWDSIVEVSAGKFRRCDAVMLKLSPALQKQRGSIKARPGRSATSSDHVVVSAEGLAINFDTLLQACRTFHTMSAPHCSRTDA